MSTLILELDSYDARFILEALRDLSDKWHHVNQTTADEDQQAEYGNDVMFLDSRRERIERLAVEAFGAQITQPTHEPVILPAGLQWLRDIWRWVRRLPVFRARRMG
jgi:hypothetical protein